MSTGTLQPPLPLQEFLPAHPPSPPLQPPLPLHAFLPAQSCLSSLAHPPSPSPLVCPAHPPSPPLPPTLPLHALWPLQTWLSPPPSSPAYATFASWAPASSPPVTPSITLPKSRRFIDMSFPSVWMSRLVGASQRSVRRPSRWPKYYARAQILDAVFCSATASTLTGHVQPRAPAP